MVTQMAQRVTAAWTSVVVAVTKTMQLARCYSSMKSGHIFVLGSQENLFVLIKSTEFLMKSGFKNALKQADQRASKPQVLSMKPRLDGQKEKEGVCYTFTQNRHRPYSYYMLIPRT